MAATMSKVRAKSRAKSIEVVTPTPEALPETSATIPTPIEAAWKDLRHHLDVIKYGRKVLNHFDELEERGVKQKPRELDNRKNDLRNLAISSLRVKALEEVLSTSEPTSKTDVLIFAVMLFAKYRRVSAALLAGNSNGVDDDLNAINAMFDHLIRALQPALGLTTSELGLTWYWFDERQRPPLQRVNTAGTMVIEPIPDECELYRRENGFM